VTEAEQDAAVDPSRDLDGSRFPTDLKEFQETFPVPPDNVRKAAFVYCEWVT